MIVYEASKKEFLNDVRNQQITEKIYDVFKEKYHRLTSHAEIMSWENSMKYMDSVLREPLIPENAEVAIEYKIPNTSKRIDFIIAGHDEDEKECAVIVELKQWTEVENVGGEGVVLSDEFEEIVGQHASFDATQVKTFVGGGKRLVAHPSYQVFTYYKLLKEFNENVENNDIKLVPCAFLHNYIKQKPDPLTDIKYERWLDEAPVFVRGDVDALGKFISKYIKYGDGKTVLYDIDNGKIRPSKALQDSVSSMLKGNEEFLMVDEQKVVFEIAKSLANTCKSDMKKRVLIVEGGPGTGKTVLAINLLSHYINRNMTAFYVSKNAAPRNVFAEKLAQDNFKRITIKNLMHGSGEFVNSDSNEVDCILVDEAHRLNEKSGLFANLGENQVKEIINAGLFTVFFIDESQRVTLKDIGSISEIEKYAEEYGAEVIKTKLESQFRCNGSDAYLAWLDDLLGIRETANDTLDIDYDFRVFDDPNEMRKAIEEKNRINNKARIVSGYCWDWVSEGKNRSDIYDIMIPEYDFKMSWNLGNTSTWAIDPTSINEAGCIHTCQGLEFDYVGVIIGDDLKFENDSVTTHFENRASSDQSLKGIKTLYKENKEKALSLSDEIIKNTYRTLMTRGQKGCYVYCTDSKLASYIRDRIK